MSTQNELKISDSILEELRCAICKDYLSCAPIQVLPDGNSICGRCGPSINDATSYRELRLESMMSKITFPCKYQKYNCKERLLFGHVNEHESVCNFRSFACASLVVGNNCSWEGPLLQMHEHFTNDHAMLITQRGEFEIQVEEDVQGILMFVINEVVMIVKYTYNADTTNLYYDIRYFERNVIQMHNKITLMNCLEYDYSVTLRGADCKLYSADFYSEQEDSDVLLVNNYLDILHNPDCMIIVMDLTVTKCKGVGTNNILKPVINSLLSGFRNKFVLFNITLSLIGIYFNNWALIIFFVVIVLALFRRYCK